MKPKNRPETTLQKVDRFAAYLFFIASVSLYFYWSKDLGLLLLEKAPDDEQIHYFMMGLGICWFGSVLLIGQQLRRQLDTYPGWRPYFISITPLLIIPSVWLMLQLFNLIEV